MPEIVESSSPIVDTPEVLGEEQTREASLSFIEQINKNKSEQRAAGAVIHGEKKPRGRPRATTPTPPKDGPVPPKTASDIDKEMAELERRRNAKKRKQDEYVRKIVDDANEQIMLWLMGSGLPSAVLYQNGRAPVEVVDDKYTEVGNMLAIKPMQARALASFAVECEYSERGIKMANAMSGSTVGLLFKGLLAGAMIVQYGRQMQQAFAKIQPLLEARNAYLAQQAAAQRNEPAQRTAVSLDAIDVR